MAYPRSRLIPPPLTTHNAMGVQNMEYDLQFFMDLATLLGVAFLFGAKWAELLLR